jgi:hypothetical protein
MGSEQFAAWRRALYTTQQAAAIALGISKAEVRLYEAGCDKNGDEVHIPRVVELACGALSAGITGFKPADRECWIG